MEVEERTLSFSIQGEFITQLTREWFYCAEKDIHKIIGILVDCMAGTDTPEEQLKRYAEDVLLGRAAIVGNTSDGTYCLEIYEPGEEKLPCGMDIWKLPIKLKETERKLEEMYKQWSVAMELVPENIKREIRKELGEETVEDKQQEALDGFIKRMTDQEEHSTEDYGWLEPNGTFHAVEWGNHQEWANNYLEKNLTPEEQFDAMVEINTSGMAKSGTDVVGVADYLVKRGWILLHNPTQGIAFPTSNPTGRITKAQKEFLYDYYTERNCEKEANAVWEEG